MSSPFFRSRRAHPARSPGAPRAPARGSYYPRFASPAQPGRRARRCPPRRSGVSWPSASGAGIRKETMRIALACDHAGYRYKEEIKVPRGEGPRMPGLRRVLRGSGGLPRVIRPAAEAVARGECERGHRPRAARATAKPWSPTGFRESGVRGGLEPGVGAPGTRPQQCERGLDRPTPGRCADRPGDRRDVSRRRPSTAAAMPAGWRLSTLPRPRGERGERSRAPAEEVLRGGARSSAAAPSTIRWCRSPGRRPHSSGGSPGAGCGRSPCGISRACGRRS